ncbi:MAG: M14 family zinc carboxypeptidase [Armatimonadota bacterium]
MERLQALETSDRVRLFRIGWSVEKRPIYGVELTGGAPQKGGVRIMLLCGQHGNEPTPVTAMLDLAEELARSSDPHRLALLEKCTILLVPVVNPDGFARYKRLNARGADLNRDWGFPSQPETKAVARLASDFKPQLLVDEHEWKEIAPGEPDCMEVAGSGRGTPAVLARLLASRVQANGVKLRTVYYRNSENRRLAHRSFNGKGICSMLVETSPCRPAAERRRIYRELVLSLADELAFPKDARIAQCVRPVRGECAPKSPRPCATAFPYWFAVASMAGLMASGLIRLNGGGLTDRGRPTGRPQIGRRAKLDPPTLYLARSEDTARWRHLGRA